MRSNITIKKNFPVLYLYGFTLFYRFLTIRLSFVNSALFTPDFN